MSAEKVAKITAPGTSKLGIFYRGNSRPPEEIFIADKNTKGYVFVIAAKDIPDDYWVPGTYPLEKNHAVSCNQEFAVQGAVPGTSISHAYEVTKDNPADKSRKIKNEEYSLRSASKCTILKSRAGGSCDPAGWADVEETGLKKPAPGGTEGGKDMKRFVGQKIAESKLLQFIGELDSGSISSLIKGLKDGEFTFADVQLAFKRELSEAMDHRWTDFESWEKAAESLKNIVDGIVSTARFKTPVGYWSDVIQRLPDTAKEISKGKIPEEKLEIANKNVIRVRVCILS
ncbi:hypothetical protein J3459_017390 [Metarhizium acridum]|nr:hypothetical protein J3459_017390 [Metarhizium acridum]